MSVSVERRKSVDVRRYLYKACMKKMKKKKVDASDKCSVELHAANRLASELQTGCLLAFVFEGGLLYSCATVASLTSMTMGAV